MIDSSILKNINILGYIDMYCFNNCSDRLTSKVPLMTNRCKIIKKLQLGL